MVKWLLDQTPMLTPEEVQASFPPVETRLRASSRANLGILLNDVVVHDTKKLFGGADIRLDAIVVHGGQADGSQVGDFYQPTTFHFSDVRDGDRLSIEQPGLLVFYGRPRHFLDIYFMMSRDRKDSEDLGNLLATRMNSPEIEEAAGGLLGLAVAAPTASAVIAAAGAAAVLGNFAAQLLQEVTGNSIGVYRTAYLQYQHRFGLGRHPAAESYRVQDLSFWYEITADRAPSRQ